MKELTRGEYLTVKNPIISDYEKGLDYIMDIKDSFHLTYDDYDGVIRWKIDKSVPNPSILGFWKYIGYAFDYNYSFTVGLEES